MYTLIARLVICSAILCSMSVGCGGCQSALLRRTDNSELTITPGVGISNLVEIGMTLDEVKKHTGNLIVQKLGMTGGFACSVPYVGAYWEQRSENELISTISFLVDPSVYELPCFSTSVSRFRGRISGLACAEERNLRREDLIRVFGAPAHRLDISQNPEKDSHQSWLELREFLGKGQSVARRTADNREVLYYPAMGVRFVLENGVVYTLEISAPVDSKNSLSGVPPKKSVGGSSGGEMGLTEGTSQTNDDAEADETGGE